MSSYETTNTWLPYCTYDHALLPAPFLNDMVALLDEQTQKIARSGLGSYDTPESFMHLPFDQAYQKECLELAYEKRKLHPSMIVVIGIGGSNLGTLALYEALKDESHIPLYCADALDSDTLAPLMGMVQQTLQNHKNVIVVVVTKSGTTTETVAQAAIFIELLKQYRPHDYQKLLVIITDHSSPLWLLGTDLGCEMLAIPTAIGGRYSVFSAVGLFPLAVAGMDIQKLWSGAQDAIAHVIAHPHNDSAVRAALLWYHYRQGLVVHDTFIFDKMLISYGAWYRQIIAESLGKQGHGILPTLSLGTTDLHSMVQLYLAGPRIRSTTFIHTEPHHHIAIHSAHMPAYATHTVNSLNTIIYTGVQNTYAQQQLPFVSWNRIQKNEYTLGALLHYNMIETIHLAHLMQVNAFDQPEVELYKKEVSSLFQKRQHGIGQQ